MLIRVAAVAVYSLLRREAKLCHRLAEDGEGVSEARPDREAEEIRPRRYVVDSQTETIDRRWGLASEVSVVRFGKRREATYRSGLEISGAWVVGRIHRVRSELFWLKMNNILAIPFFRYGTRDQQTTGYFLIAACLSA
jgi:hypothetical protein